MEHTAHGGAGFAPGARERTIDAPSLLKLFYRHILYPRSSWRVDNPTLVDVPIPAKRWTGSPVRLRRDEVRSGRTVAETARQTSKNLRSLSHELDGLVVRLE